jgi:uncharacterized protein (DUF4415 family)
MNPKSIGNETVYFHLDPSNPPTITEEQMQALRDLRDEDIDLSDIPEQASTGWRRVSDLIPAENKQQITLRLDADVIEFFRATGRRYQSRINAALREYVNANKKSASQSS